MTHAGLLVGLVPDVVAIAEFTPVGVQWLARFEAAQVLHRGGVRRVADLGAAGLAADVALAAHRRAPGRKITMGFIYLSTVLS